MTQTFDPENLVPWPTEPVHDSDPDWDDLIRRGEFNINDGDRVNGHNRNGGEGGDNPATWAPVDLTDILNGTYIPEAPSLMCRTDGKFLLYRGRVHSFHGESESGKSLIIQALAAQLLIDGGRVVYIDYESDAAAVVGRLLELGVPVEVLRARLVYIHPEAAPGSREVEREAWARLLADRFDLAVIDGVTDALGTVGAKSNDNDEIAAWCRNVARRIARNTGAAVVLIDHVTKDADTRGRFALGGQAKMNALDGAAYVVEVVDALGRGLRGVVAIRVAKDRPGGIRANCGPFRKLDRTQEAARITVDSRTPNRIVVTVDPPSGLSSGDPVAARFRPTHLMEKVSRFLQGSSETSLRGIRDRVSGKANVIDEAVAILVAEGFASERSGQRNARMFTHLRLYTEFTDPLIRQPEDGVSAGPCPDRVPTVSRTQSGRPCPRVPIPEGDTDTVGSAGRDQQMGTVSRTQSAPDPNHCADCGFHPNSVGHFANCDPRIANEQQPQQ